MGSRLGWRTLLVLMRRVVLVLLVLLLLGSCSGVSYIERIVLVNRTDYSIQVEVRGAEDTSWLSLGIATRNEATEVQEVTDQGATWVFRFEYLGEPLGDERISRSDLVRNQWRYEIPQRLGEELKEKGHAPSFK